MNVEIFTKTNCPHCTQAKALLTKLGAQYQEKLISSDQDRKELLERIPSAKTVPQIIVNGSYVIGGNDNLQKLNSEGKLFVDADGNLIVELTQEKVMEYYGRLADRADMANETNSINVSNMTDEEILKIIRK